MVHLVSSLLVSCYLSESHASLIFYSGNDSTTLPGLGICESMMDLKKYVYKNQ